MATKNILSDQSGVEKVALSAKNRVIGFLEYLGSLFAVSGTFMMASGLPSHGRLWVWLVWLIGNLMFCIWSVSRRAWGILGLNAVYVALDLVGIFRSF
jgi:hypothetical protein